MQEISNFLRLRGHSHSDFSHFTLSVRSLDFPILPVLFTFLLINKIPKLHNAR